MTYQHPIEPGDQQGMVRHIFLGGFIDCHSLYTEKEQLSPFWEIGNIVDVVKDMDGTPDVVV